MRFKYSSPTLFRYKYGKFSNDILPRQQKIIAAGLHTHLIFNDEIEYTLNVECINIF